MLTSVPLQSTITRCVECATAVCKSSAGMMQCCECFQASWKLGLHVIVSLRALKVFRPILVSVA